MDSLSVLQSIFEALGQEIRLRIFLLLTTCGFSLVFTFDVSLWP